MKGTQENGVYWDRGAVSLQDRSYYGRGFRFIAQIELGWNFPQIIHQVIVPREAIPKGKYPVELNDGPGWEKVRKYNNVSFEVYREVTKVAARQLGEIFNHSGVLIEDRAASNMMLSETQEPSTIVFHGKYWRLWQVDLGLVYDACTDREYIDRAVRLSERTEPIKIRNKIETRQKVAIVCRRLVENLLDARHTSRKMRQQLLKFWTLDEQTFESLQNFLNELT